MTKQSVEIKPCPFCGAPASVEECPSGVANGVMLSVGCDSTMEADCMGYQSTTEFNTRKEAIAAWNKRAPLSEIEKNNLLILGAEFGVRKWEAGWSLERVLGEVLKLCGGK